MKLIYFFLRYLMYSMYPFKKIIPSQEGIYNYTLNIINNLNYTNSYIPRKIWIYWEGKNKPDYINFFVDRIRKQNIDHEVLFLDETTISNYLPEFTMDQSVSILPAHKSDVIRLMLLKKYGGIWLDATILFHHNIEWVHTIDCNYKYDLIGYYRKISTYDLERPIIENWFMASSENNEFITLWLKELLPITVLGSDGYWKEISKDENFHILKQGISNPEYLLAYLAAQKVQLNSNKNFNFHLRCCEESAFHLQRSVKWRPYKIAYLLSRCNSDNINYELIKLTGSDRLLIDIIKKTKFFNRKCLLSGYYLKRDKDA